jgi:hypothetical protein
MFEKGVPFLWAVYRETARLSNIILCAAAFL